MNHTQILHIIRDALRQAASQCACTPSEAHRPNGNNKAAIAARNMAIRLAFNQGVSIDLLEQAFDRSRKTIATSLKLSA